MSIPIRTRKCKDTQLCLDFVSKRNANVTLVFRMNFERTIELTAYLSTSSVRPRPLLSGESAEVATLQSNSWNFAVCKAKATNKCCSREKDGSNRKP